MPKGEYTRTEAGRRAYFAVTGIELPASVTNEEIKAKTHAMPEDQKRRCHELYLQLMSIGRPEYMRNHAKVHPSRERRDGQNSGSTLGAIAAEIDKLKNLKQE